MYRKIIMSGCVETSSRSLVPKTIIHTPASTVAHHRCSERKRPLLEECWTLVSWMCCAKWRAREGAWEGIAVEREHASSRYADVE